MFKNLDYKYAQFLDKNKSLLVFLVMILLVNLGIIIGMIIHGNRFRIVDEACRKGNGTMALEVKKLWSDAPAIYSPICTH